MNRRLVMLFAAALAIAGCQARAKVASHPATSDPPVSVVTFTDQKQIWECPQCGMDYDRAGVCGMCDVELVAMKVDYLCPADGQPVEHGGKCPRCAANARVVKTALAAALPPALTGK